MLVFILRRLGAGALLLFVISTFTFFLLNLTGADPARQILGPTATVEQVEQKRVELGLTEPVLAQYWNWLTSAIQGDLGASWYGNQPVTQVVALTLPPTLSMVIGSILLASILGAGVGVAAALRRGALDRGLQVSSTFVQAIPGFLVAIVLAYVFAVQLRLLPATGYVGLFASPSLWFASIILPVVALALGAVASIAMQIRGSMIDVLRQDFVRTLRSRGIPESRVLLQHALRNAAGPTLTTVSLMFIVSISGSVIVEKVFNIPGIGTQASISASQGDLPVVMGVVVITVVLVVIVNLLVDLAQGWVNPKVRVS
ncbi:ABC transporter permease [Pseudoclavibacter sp. RFBB5]|uniref:ABC transporter permease n=1 Tax=Pseudoclavibacter sp. RFBB5 TaxID=2080574 RepID=UPI000CE77F25|nr:ABC transporter permease [Pseudoclavibacter sp. RFBB5]PPG27681.1 ABC transporter permease [Pseudoclavibacter sp. RFBB5]